MQRTEAQKPAVDLLIRGILILITVILLVHICGFAYAFQVPGKSVQYLVADDSMITLRVAFHSAQHLGPYFNPGERTAASTSLFWPLLLGQVFRFTHFDLARSVLAFSVLSDILTAFVVAVVVWFAADLYAAALTAITLLLLPGIAEYGNSAWEHLPQALFVTMAFLALLGRLPRISKYRWECCLVFLSLAFLMRPDALPLMLPVAFVLAWLRKNGLPSAAAAISFSVGCVLLYLGLHHHFYDTFVPNTYHLKVAFGVQSVILGIHYLIREGFSSATPVFIVAFVLLALLARQHSLELRVIATGLVLQLGYLVVVGGDWFGFGRFFLMLSPIVVLLTWEALLSAQLSRLSWMRPALATLCVAASLISSLRYALSHEKVDEAAIGMRPVSGALKIGAPWAVQESFIREHLSPADGEIGLFVLGSLSYYMPEYRFADFLGKADSHIANEPLKWGPIGHNKWDIPYTLQARHVSVVPFEPLSTAEAQQRLRNHGDYAFFPAFQLDPYMNAHYTFRNAKQLGSPGPLGLYVRNDLLDRFPDMTHRVDQDNK